MKHRRSDSIVDPRMEGLHPIPLEVMSPLLPAPGLGVIKYNECLPGKHSLYFITRTPPFAWRSQFEWRYIPAEALSSPLVAAGLGVNDFNVCSHCEQTLKSLTLTAPFE